MSEQLLRLEREQLPPHVPPSDAWKQDPSKLKKFYAPTDDRGFVLPDATVEIVKDLFVDDYQWPVDPRFQATKPDVHHLHWMKRIYEPDNYHGRTIPKAWRDLPSVKIIGPRQFHNVLHDVTLPPLQPKFAEMEAHLEAYRLAKQTFEAARNTSRARNNFSKQKIVGDSSDKIASEILIEKFDKQFRGYRRSIEAMMAMAGLETLRLDIEKFDKRQPHEIVRLLGLVANRDAVNFLPIFETVRWAA